MSVQEVAARQLPQTLRVSHEDARELQQLAETLAANCLDEFELELRRSSAPGNSASQRWRELRQLEGVRIYEELRAADGAAPAIPSLLLRGNIPGTMNDMLFAHSTACATDDAMKLRSHYVQDGVLDSRVLAEIARPSVDAPFHRVAVTWRLFTTRDYVCLDATGVLLLPRGERVGYSISHSVAFDAQLPSFEKLSIDRGNVSVCSLFREHPVGGGSVECFARGFFDIDTADDRVAGNLALRLVSNQWLSFARHMQFAQMKKLAWFLRRSLELRLDNNYVDDVSALKSKSKSGGKPQCCVCDKSLGFLGSRKHCRRCDRAVCSGCQVKNRLCWLAADAKGVHEGREVFCSRCVLEAVQSDALAIAQEEIRRGSLHSGSSSSSDMMPHSLSWSTAHSSDESDG